MLDGSDMDADRSLSMVTSHLFTVRVWREELGDGHSEWRGKVQYVLSGEARYFREWTALIAFVREQVGDQTTSSADVAETRPS
jgi:hypothetical protein